MSNRHFRFQEAGWFPLSLDNFQRFEEKENLQELEEIILAGLGGIGSWTALLLSRILTKNTELILIDPDTYEIENVAGQFVKNNQLGFSKVGATESNLLEFSDYQQSIALNAFYDENSDVSPIMISGFDNMEARQIFFNKWKSQEDRKIFIDGRLSAQFYQVFCIYNDASAKEYEENWLYLEESDLMKEECSFKQTSHFAAEIGSQIVKMLTKALSPYAALPPNFLQFNFQTYKYDIRYFK